MTLPFVAASLNDFVGSEDYGALIGAIVLGLIIYAGYYGYGFWFKIRKLHNEFYPEGHSAENRNFGILRLLPGPDKDDPVNKAYSDAYYRLARKSGIRVFAALFVAGMISYFS
ncbi:hypothetical protein KPG71_03560 [Roseovarius sp. PS-C2]|uniref:hypothetical protein n=1 Tax=Roseovarius sp. PS-C2 TaxID=2820814 RepID=UPI001C0C9A15|nr:hypothetical protein [Roseovarius sp. PS-C2]MBU3259084.1 hypothetical protein [Roseovarius sp. PS-C2]